MQWDKFVLSMASLRLMSGMLELIAAVVMLRLNEPAKALVVNSTLAVIGPLIFIATTTIGLIGIADKLTYSKFVWIGVGAACLIIGILKK